MRAAEIFDGDTVCDVPLEFVYDVLERIGLGSCGVQYVPGPDGDAIVVLLRFLGGFRVVICGDSARERHVAGMGWAAGL